MLVVNSFSRKRPSRHSARIQCQVVRERDFRLVADTIYDVSLSGLLVAPADPVLTGERLIVSFRLPAGAWIDAEATVTRVIHGRRTGDRTRQLGVVFDSLPTKSRLALEGGLRGIPLRPPSVQRHGTPEWPRIRALSRLSSRSVADPSRLPSLRVA
jgi:hypothetical protein